MSKNFILLFLFCFVKLAYSQSYDLIDYVEFRDSETCLFEDQGQHIDMCKLESKGFEPFTAVQKQIVIDSLNKLDKIKNKQLIERIFSKGDKLVFFYVNSGTEQAGSLTFGKYKIIFLHPKFFESKIYYDNYPEQSHALIHELFHFYSNVLSGGDLNNSELYSTLSYASEWHNRMGLNPVIMFDDWIIAGKQRIEHEHNGHPNDAVKVDFEYSMQRGVPSIYSLFNIREFYAEVASFLYHSPKNLNNLSDSLKEWLFNYSQLNWLIPEDFEYPKHQFIYGLDRSGDFKNAFDFVGQLKINNKPKCTSFVLKHGVIITARHCFAGIKVKNKEFLDSLITYSEYKSQDPQKKHYMFLDIDFKNRERSLVVDGFSISAVIRDDKLNDWVYIIYDPNKTIGLINIPEWILYDEKGSVEEIKDFISVGFPMPLKVQRLERVLVKNGEWTGYKGNLNTDKENLFPGEYWESTIKGWYGASGSPIFKKNTLKDNSYILLGLLSHTFELEEGRVRTSAIKNDDWGNYTNTAISPAINLSINGELH